MYDQETRSSAAHLNDEHKTGVDYTKTVEDEQESPEEYLDSVYYDPLNPGGYTGLAKLWNYVKSDNPHKLKRKDVQAWLAKQDTYKRHKSAATVFPRQKILMSYIDQQWDADIMDMSKFTKFNQGYNYVAVFIDIFF